MTLTPWLWPGAIGAVLLLTSGRGRKIGALIVGVGDVAGFLALLAATHAAAVNFGAETAADARAVQIGAGVGLVALLAVAACLGWLPDRALDVSRGRASLRLVVPASAVAAWAATACLGVRAWGVASALGPLSEAQTIQCWSTFGGCALVAVLLSGRAWRVALGATGVAAVGVTAYVGWWIRPVDTADAGDPAALAVTTPASDPLSRDVPGGRIVDVPVAGPARVEPYVLSPGRDARLQENDLGVWKARKQAQALPGFYASTVQNPPVRVATYFVLPAGVLPSAVALDRGWTPEPPLTAQSIRDSLTLAALFLTRNQTSDGKFTYIVKGDGTAGPGYNYPRHAGTAWFLAREATALLDPIARSAANAGLQHLDDVSGHTPDGRAFVLDPTRTDGRAWIGTTALAVAAVEALGGDNATVTPASARGWEEQVIASVGEDGLVRGEMLTKNGDFVADKANSYGQGQVMVALAAMAHSDRPLDPTVPSRARDALGRASTFVAGWGYYGPHPLWVDDEHWMCLAAHGIHALNARDSSATVDAVGPDAVCAAYASIAALAAPPPGAGLPPAAGPSAGGAEAVVARAFDHPSPALRAASLDYAAFYLGSQYVAGDAPLLPSPDHLLGGFRDGPYDLDVQIDSVQHIGGALLGTLALLGEDRAGMLP